MRVAFNTANLVARVTGYRYIGAEWGAQHDKTAAAMNEKEWAAICREIAAAGYQAVEVWIAHCDPRFTDEKRARGWRRILDDNGLTPIGLAGPLTEENARICQWMGIPAANGGFWGTTLAEVRRVVAATGLRCNFENHPEKSAEEIRGPDRRRKPRDRPVHRHRLAGHEWRGCGGGHPRAGSPRAARARQGRACGRRSRNRGTGHRVRGDCRGHNRAERDRLPGVVLVGR